MTGLYIFLLVILTLILLLILPVSLLFRFENGNRQVFVKYLFFTLPFFSGKKKKKVSTDGEEKPQKSAKKTENKKEKQDIHDILSLIGYLAKESFRGVSAVRKYIVFDKIQLQCKIAGEDAADTAIRYGQLQILAGTTFASLQNFFKLKFDIFSIIPDFAGGENDFKLSFRVRAPLAAALFIAARFFIRLILLKLDDENGGKEHGKASN